MTLFARLSNEQSHPFRVILQVDVFPDLFVFLLNFSKVTHKKKIVIKIRTSMEYRLSDKNIYCIQIGGLKIPTFGFDW